jgi:hypothetical protein
MSAFAVILLIVVAWLIFQYLIPKLPEPIRTVATIVLVLVAIVFLLRLAGIHI